MAGRLDAFAAKSPGDYGIRVRKEKIRLEKIRLD